MKTISLWLTLVVSVTSCGTTQMRSIHAPIADGLYFGRRGGFHTPCAAFVIVQGTAAVEVYQPLKGEVLQVLTEPLVASEEGGVLYKGRETEILRDESNLIVRARSRKFIFKSIPVSLAPETVQMLNEYRNRSYLFHEREKTVRMIQEKLAGDMNVFARVGKLQYTYGVPDMARSLPHDEFLEAYAKVRDRIISEIVATGSH